MQYWRVLHVRLRAIEEGTVAQARPLDAPSQKRSHFPRLLFVPGVVIPLATGPHVTRSTPFYHPYLYRNLFAFSQQTHMGFPSYHNKGK